MPPKIEEIPQGKPKKNPFAIEQKKNTIQRNASEIYSKRKGLNKPDFKSDKPIDILFDDLEKVLDLPYEDLSIDYLYKRLYQNEETDEMVKRYKVIEKLLDDLLKLQQYSLDSNMDDTNLITISLHDIRTFSKLINVIIIQGIYPVISTFQIGILFEKRRLKEFNSKSVHIASLTKNLIIHQNLLQLIYEKLFLLFSQPSDIADLLTKGTGYSDFLVVSISLITVPHFNFDSCSKAKYLKQFEFVEQIPQTFELYQTYSLLLTTPSPSYFKSFVMEKLKRLPYNAPRKNGVLSLIEFILGLRESENVDVEKFDHVANVILSKPNEVSTIDYFTSIGDQLYTLLININRPHITSCVGYVIEKLWNLNKKVTRDFIIKRIWQNFNPEMINTEVLVTEAQLNNNVNVLISLTKKGLETSLYKVIMEPILSSLWGYYIFCRRNSKGTEIITNILTSYFTIVKSDSISGLKIITNNLVTDGGNDWKFEIGPNNMVQIVKRKAEYMDISKEDKLGKYLNDLDFSVSGFIKLLENIDDALIRSLFNEILKSWLENKTLLLDEDENPFIKLIDLKLLEGIGEKFKEILAQTPAEMLELVKNFLQSKKGAEDIIEGDSDDEDEESLETLPILLELLSAILSENDVIVDDECVNLLQDINKSLSNLNNSGLNQSVRNSISALHTRIQDLLMGEPKAQNELDLQQNQLKRAITSLNDPLVPIRAHGLHLLRQLIEMKSPIISLDFVINLHLVQLKDSEPFIYLNVIKGLEKLIELDEPEVLKILCHIYLDQNEELDEKLKIGEVLLRYITNTGELFSGDSATLIVETTLQVIRKGNDFDNRLRMSGMSLLGTCCKVNPLGLISNLENALDCAIGVLNLETSKDQAIMRRAAIILILDLILGTSETDKVQFPSAYREKVVITLRYITETDNDLLNREQAQKVLDTIGELVKLAMELYNE